MNGPRRYCSDTREASIIADMAYLYLAVSRKASLDRTEPALALRHLGLKGFHVIGIKEAREMLASVRFDLLVYEGPSITSSEVRVLADLVEDKCPIMVASDSFSEKQQIDLLEAGAYDFIPKCEDERLASLRVQRALRAFQPPDTDHRRKPLYLGTLVLDPRSLSATARGRPIQLTTQQFNVLFVMAWMAERIVERQTIRRIIGAKSTAAGRSTDMQISRIRKELRRAGDTTITLEAVYSHGYRLTCDGPHTLAAAASTDLPNA